MAICSSTCTRCAGLCCFCSLLNSLCGQGELLRAVVTLLARRGKLSSTTLRPFLHLVTQLDLSGASASLNLAKTVSRAPHLSALAVRGRLCDSMAASLHAPCLVSLDCSCSPRLTVAGLGSLALSCPLLASLSCSWCGGIDSLSSLSSLSHLSVLDASQCPVAEGCCWPPRLVRLSLGGCSSLRRAGGWPESLEQLDLSRCVELVELTHSFPAALRELSAVALPAAAELDRAAGGCGRLAWLDLSETELRGPPAACRAGLQSLLMERCGEGAALGAMPMLTVLSLSGGQLRGGDWAASLPSLSTLCLSHTPLGDRDVAAVLAALPALQRLDLSFCEGLTDAALEAVRTGGSGLLLLRLYGCPQLSLAALRRLAHACPHMRLCAPTSE